MSILAEGTVRRLLDAGTSVVVGAADDAGRPACARAAGVVTTPDGHALVVYLPTATCSEVVANVATTRRLAVLVSDPVSHGTVQLKGRVRVVRVAEEEERPVVRGCMERLTAVLAEAGVPPRLLAGVVHWPAFAVELEVEAAYDQTPGPRAGQQVAPS